MPKYFTPRKTGPGIVNPAPPVNKIVRPAEGTVYNPNHDRPRKLQLGERQVSSGALAPRS